MLRDLRLERRVDLIGIYPVPLGVGAAQDPSVLVMQGCMSMNEGS